MLGQLRKYQQIITQTVVALFLITGSFSAWASVTIEVNKAMFAKQQSMEHTDHRMMKHESGAKSQQDCCQQSENCNNLCCNFCMVGGVAGLALLPSHYMPISYHQTRYFQNTFNLPDGMLSSTPYRPPQTLLI